MDPEGRASREVVASSGSCFKVRGYLNVNDMVQWKKMSENYSRRVRITALE